MFRTSPDQLVDLPVFTHYEDAYNFEYNATPVQRGQYKGDKRLIKKKHWLTIRAIKKTHVVDPRSPVSYPDLVVKMYDTDILRFTWSEPNMVQVYLGKYGETATTYMVIKMLTGISMRQKAGLTLVNCLKPNGYDRTTQTWQTENYGVDPDTVAKFRFSYSPKKVHRVWCNQSYGYELEPKPKIFFENPMSVPMWRAVRKSFNEKLREYNVDRYIREFLIPMDKLRPSYPVKEVCEHLDLGLRGFLDGSARFRSDRYDLADRIVGYLKEIQRAMSPDLDPKEAQYQKNSILFRLARECNYVDWSDVPKSELEENGIKFWETPHCVGTSKYAHHKEKKNFDRFKGMKALLHKAIKYRHADEVFEEKTMKGGDEYNDQNKQFVDWHKANKHRFGMLT